MIATTSTLKFERTLPSSYLNWRLGPVLRHEIKIRMATSQNCAPMCSRLLYLTHKLSLPAQPVVFFCKVTIILCKEYVTVWGCAAVLFLFIFENLTYKWGLRVPAGFHVSKQLDQTGYHLPMISTPIFCRCCSRRTFCHGLQLKQPTLSLSKHSLSLSLNMA